MAAPVVPSTSLGSSEVPAGGSYLDPPSVILRLNPALGDNGCIQNPQDVPVIVDFMKESNQMVNRCIILNVIKATVAPSTLAKFMDVGGWGMLNVWLSEAKKAQNTSLLTELLQVLQKLPVGIEALKQGNMGKLIKQLSKQESGEVGALAGTILTKWMAVFREGQSAKAKSAEDRKNSATDDSSAKATTSKKKQVKKKDVGKKGEAGAAPESMQPPPGPLVALGRPKDKAQKRPRDLLVGQPPAEKKTKASPGLADSSKSGKAFVESEGFMNAISTQAAKHKEKKIKKVQKISKLSRTNSSSEPVLETRQESLPSVSEEGEASSEPTEGENDGKKKKKVSWATDDNLTKIHYFLMDESERTNVNRRTSFLDAAQQEKMREREALESGLMFSRDRLIEMIPWKRPAVLDVQSDLVVRGVESKERDIQAEREGKVLAQLFLNKASVQPSPMEPDPEPDMVETEPKLIPLLEPNASGGNQNQPPSFASPTAIAPSGAIPPGSPLPSPASTINQAQNLINYFNKHGPNPGGLPGPGSLRGTGRGAPNGGPGGPPGRGVPNGGSPGTTSYQAPDSNYYSRGRGYPPPSQGVGRQWRGAEGGDGYFEEGNFRGSNDMSAGRGRGFSSMRGRGRGFPRRRGQICKHFLTHGCKMGPRCRFMHCSPEDLATTMATNEQEFDRRPMPARGGRRVDARQPPFFMPPKPSPPQNSPPIHVPATAPPAHKTEPIANEAQALTN